MKILIVDDEYSSRDLLEHALRPYGACTEATNGLEAVAMFKKALLDGDPFNLVLMDILMPEMDGQQALKEIRLAEKAIYGISLNMKEYAHIIMVTILDDPGQLVEAYTKGKCSGYLNKPIVLGELFDKLRKNKLIK